MHGGRAGKACHAVHRCLASHLVLLAHTNHPGGQGGLRGFYTLRQALHDGRQPRSAPRSFAAQRAFRRSRWAARLFHLSAGPCQPGLCACSAQQQIDGSTVHTSCIHIATHLVHVISPSLSSHQPAPPPPGYPPPCKPPTITAWGATYSSTFPCVALPAEPLACSRPPPASCPPASPPLPPV